jgi:hypothetical protein
MCLGEFAEICLGEEELLVVAVASFSLCPALPSMSIAGGAWVTVDSNKLGDEECIAPSLASDQVLRQVTSSSRRTVVADEAVTASGGSMASIARGKGHLTLCSTSSTARVRRSSAVEAVDATGGDATAAVATLAVAAVLDGAVTSSTTCEPERGEATGDLEDETAASSS